jgi:DNA polymerase-3 subunit epsilon
VIGTRCWKGAPPTRARLSAFVVALVQAMTHPFVMLRSVERRSAWTDGELLGFDLETTGLDPTRDRPVSFALVTVRGGVVERRRTSLVDPGQVIPAAATAIHGISTDRARREGIALADAVAEIADALVAAAARGVPVVGMKLDYDLTMLDAQCRALDGVGLRERGWSGPVLDGLVLDRRCDRYRKGRRTLGDLCVHYSVAVEHAHDAACDAEAAIGVVRAICARFPALVRLGPVQLHRYQVRWHREWAESFDRWRREQDLVPLHDRDFHWPIGLADAA